jgi:hypothetical protein
LFFRSAHGYRAGFLYHKESAEDTEVLLRFFPEVHQNQWDVKDGAEMIAFLSYQNLKEIEGNKRSTVAQTGIGLPENYRDYEGFYVYDAQKCRID